MKQIYVMLIMVSWAAMHGIIHDLSKTEDWGKYPNVVKWIMQSAALYFATKIIISL